MAFRQNEIRESDREAVRQFGRLNTHFDLIDFCDTAALISCLDLIIAVDTSCCASRGGDGQANLDSSGVRGRLALGNTARGQSVVDTRASVPPALSRRKVAPGV